MNILDHIGELSDSLVKLDEKIGFKRIIGYTIIILIILGLFNFRSIVKETIEVVDEISSQIHDEKMEQRDQLLFELNPVLQEFRATLNADRILYFEYHNTKENLVGIPFKYVDLVLQNLRYGVPPVPENLMTDINVGIISGLYEATKRGDVVCCLGEEDTKFKLTYPTAWELFGGTDGSSQQVFISIPGVRQPIGLIVLEWMDKDVELNRNEILNVSYRGSGSFIPRINGLIMSKSNK